MTAASRSPMGLADALPENLFREPIDCLQADHFRFRLICDLLSKLAAAPDDRLAPQTSRAVLDFLQADFLSHVADEEEDLLSFLRARGWPEGDDQTATSEQLFEQHRRNNELRLRLLPELYRLVAGQPPERPTAFFDSANALIDSLRRHLTWEEDAILPEARRRLTPDDLDELGRRMAGRRGIPFPEH